MRKRVLVVTPTLWDERQWAALAPEVRARYELVLDEPRDEDVRFDLDLEAFVEERARLFRGRIDGVLSTGDYPGALLAAALAERLGLPGTSPASVLRAQDKYRARLVQRAVAPECVPSFALLDPDDERTWPAPEEFPLFVKPVKGSFSLFARRLTERGELARLARSPALEEFRTYYLRPFREYLARHGRPEHDVGALLAEGLLAGQQVTLEGWVRGGRAHVLGLVDTRFHEGSGSFAAFEYPSHLPADVQARLARLACRVAEALELDQTLFNVEFLCDLSRGPGAERLGLVEVNPRACGQFGDLYAKVDGKHGLELALELACGEEPRPRRLPAPFAAAASVPLRTFRTVRVVRAPEAEELWRLQARHPGLLAWCEVRSGDVLAVGPDVEDGESVRYAILNAGGRDRADVRARVRALEPALGLELELEGLPPEDASGARIPTLG